MAVVEFTLRSRRQLPWSVVRSPAHPAGARFHAGRLVEHKVRLIRALVTGSSARSVDDVSDSRRHQMPGSVAVCPNRSALARREIVFTVQRHRNWHRHRAPEARGAIAHDAHHNRKSE